MKQELLVDTFEVELILIKKNLKAMKVYIFLNVYNIVLHI